MIGQGISLKSYDANIENRFKSASIKAQAFTDTVFNELLPSSFQKVASDWEASLLKQSKTASTDSLYNEINDLRATVVEQAKTIAYLQNK